MPYKGSEQLKKYHREYYLKNIARISLQKKKYVRKNKKRIKAYQHQWYLDNRILSSRILLTDEEKEVNKKVSWRKWYLKNRKKTIANNEKWRRKNKIQLNRTRSKYTISRKKRDINFKLAVRLRARLGTAIRANQKSGSAVSDLGCTISELKIYLQRRFKKGMTWQNWGIKGWHIDHIKPLISFDLSDREQLKEACNYKNLQPLWWRENLMKRDHEKFI